MRESLHPGSLLFSVVFRGQWLIDVEFLIVPQSFILQNMGGLRNRESIMQDRVSVGIKALSVQDPRQYLDKSQGLQSPDQKPFVFGTKRSLIVSESVIFENTGGLRTCESATSFSRHQGIIYIRPPVRSCFINLRGCRAQVKSHSQLGVVGTK